MPIDEPAPVAILAALKIPLGSSVFRPCRCLRSSSNGLDAAVPVLLERGRIQDPACIWRVSTTLSTLRQAAETLRLTAAVIPMLIKGLLSMNPQCKERGRILAQATSVRRRDRPRRTLSPLPRHMIPSSRRTPRNQSEIAPSRTLLDDRRDFARRARGGASLRGPEPPATTRPRLMRHGRCTTFGRGAYPPSRSCSMCPQDAGKPSTGPVRPGHAHAVIGPCEIRPGSALCPGRWPDESSRPFPTPLDYPRDFVRTEAANALGALTPGVSRVATAPSGQRNEKEPEGVPRSRYPGHRQDRGKAAPSSEPAS